MEIRTLPDIVRVQAATRPDQVALVLDDRRQTFAELHERSARAGNALRAAGVGPGDRVAFIDKNSIEYFEVLFGAAFVGAVTVAVNWRLAPAEMGYIVADAEAEVLVAHADFVAHVEQFRDALPHPVMVVVIGGEGGDVGYEDWLAGQPAEDPGHVPTTGEVAIQLYSSGTTGLPKGAQLTNGNFAALVDAAAAWAMRPGSVNMVAMPLFHIGGSGWALFGMLKGASSIVIRELDPVRLLQLVQEHRITHAFLVPAVLQFLQLVPTDGLDLSSLELVVYGASPISEEVLVGSMKQLGCAFGQVYGLTETSGAVTQLDPEDHDPGGPRAHLLRSAGRPMPGVELRIVDADTGGTLPEGEVGEVWIRTAQNMLGYWKLPDATAEALPGDGWFRSGDAGYLRDGYLYIHDRVKDMIISGGENIYPAEIENVLMAHPSVADCAVIGVPDDRWGETPKALVVPAAGTELDEAALLAHCRQHLAGFKCPRSVEAIEAVPRNPSGKILKRELRAPYWEGRERQVS